MDSLRMQQIMVIAHHDPRFFDQLNAEPQQMALRLECSPLELQTIAGLDPRLFRVDKLRGDRLLKGLLDRYTVSLWQVLSNDLFPQLRAFLSSDQFYRSVLRQAYVHQAFAAYLTASFPQLHHLVMLEMAIEDVASIDKNASDVVGEIVLNPRVQLLKLPHGLLAHYLEARKMITATALSGAEFLLAPGQSALESKRLIHRDETEWVLIEPSNPVQIGELNDSLGQILNFVKKKTFQSRARYKVGGGWRGAGRMRRSTSTISLRALDRGATFFTQAVSGELFNTSTCPIRICSPCKCRLSRFLLEVNHKDRRYHDNSLVG